MTVWHQWFRAHPRRAAQWFLRAKSGSAAPKDERKLTEWLSDSSHARDYELMKLVWKLSGEFKGDPSIDFISSQPRRRTTRPRSILSGLVAAGSIAATAVAVIYGPLLVPSEHVYATRVGEQRMVVLADGSRMFLNTASEARVKYSLFGRRVELKGGEATFEVAKNRLRPFEVATEKGIATALGTQFDVFVRPTSMEVAIIEGTVAVHAKGDPNVVGATVVHTGQLVTVDAKSRLSVGVADLRRIVSRRVETLEFDNTTVAEATAEFNRYSRMSVLATTPDVSRRRISGLFRAADTNAFANALATTLRLHRIDTPDAIYLSGPNGVTTDTK